MVLVALMLIIAGYTLMYTGFKPPNDNPFDVWYWFREAFKGV